MCLRRRNHEVIPTCGWPHDSCRETGFNFAKRIILDGDCIDPHCSIQYPCATELSLSIYRTQDKGWLMSYLNCNIALARITELHISYNHLNIDDLIKILYHMPNLDCLSFYHKPLLAIASRSAEQEAQIIDLASKSKITKLELACGNLCTLDEVQCILSFCPRLECLEIDLGEDMLKWIAESLLTKKTTRHMFSCCFWNAKRGMKRKLQTIINQMTMNIHNDCLMEFINDFLYLWW